MKEEDIDSILALIIQYKKEQNFPFNTSYENEIKKQLFIAVKQKQKNTYVCVVQSEITGYINMHICPFPMIGGKELYISDLLVKQDMRGNGIGKKLMEKAIEIAQENECTRIMLNNAKESESYRRSFYIKSGFIERPHFANFVKSVK
ncbi:MAG: GNAT family N-acetyltransferase [Spirochaetales bacterium]|nr:GNAT family N-acetyltransferase [Spirochaetales bacterium]